MTTILSDIALDQTDTGAQTGTICEPSLGVSGKRIFLAGNWFASRSTNGGSSWLFVDPFSALPATGPGVCCDQMVHYCKSRRLWIWMLQFRKSSTGNIIRIAVSSSGAPGTWTWWDTTPADIDTSWTNSWFDYPDLMETTDSLLLSFNMFSVSTDRWLRSAVLRFSLDDLKDRGTLERQAWSTEELGSLRFARGPGDSAIFASQSTSATTPGIVIFEWPDNSSTVSEDTVEVTDWMNHPYISNGPGNAPWLARLDDRITGGWRAEGVIGFAWSAASDTHHPHPYIRVARIDEDARTLIDEPDLWSASCAWAYPATVPNRRGDVGMTAFCGGVTTHPAHSVGWFDEDSGSWDMVTGAVSTHGPSDGVWGDYLDVQPDPSRKTYWIASGFALNGGSDRSNVEPRVVYFKP